MNPLTALRQALIARLGEITPEAGYNTTAGSRVESGWYNEVIKSRKTGYPMIVVQKSRDGEPKPGPARIMLARSFFVFGSVDAGLDSYEDALDDLELDIIRSLIPQGGAPLTWAPRGTSGISIGTPEQVPPGDGEKVATVLIPVTFDLIIKH